MAQRFTTTQLSDMLEVPAKNLRSYLRRHHAKSHVSGSVWKVSTAMLEELRKHYGS